MLNVGKGSENINGENILKEGKGETKNVLSAAFGKEYALFMPV